MRNPTKRLALFLVGAAFLAGCTGYDDTTVSEPKVADAAPAPAATTKECDNDGTELQSYDPDQNLPSDRAVERIRDEKQKLVVGVSADQLQMGSRNPGTGVIEGFDIDMAGYVAREIFGGKYDPKTNLELKVITPADRIPFLVDGTVDMVARNMTINCARWQQIAFSQQYYASGQRLLVASTLPDDTTLKSLGAKGARVCAPASTTSLDNLIELAPKAIPVVVQNDTDCLLAFQNSEADALTTDDTVLAGLAAQDPNAKVIQDGPPLTDEPYGLGVNSDDVDLVQLINTTLEKIRANGDWQRSYDKWLRPTLGDAGEKQPDAVYGREPGDR